MINNQVTGPTELSEAKDTTNPSPTPNPTVTDQVQAQPADTQLATTGDTALLLPNKDDDDDDVADQLSKFPPSVLIATKLLIGSWVCLILGWGLLYIFLKIEARENAPPRSIFTCNHHQLIQYTSYSKVPNHKYLEPARQTHQRSPCSTSRSGFCMESAG
jgi:hypothetical protein